MAKMAKIVVVAEHDRGSLREISYELLGLAHRVQGEDGAVKALLVGEGISELAQALATAGANEVIYAEGPAVRDYTGDGYRRAIETVLEEESPDLVLFGNTPLGWDLAPVVAARLSVPVVSGCSKVAIEGGRGIFTRKAFNGKFVHEVELSNARPMIATVDKGSALPFEGKTAGSVRRVEVSLAEGDLRARYVETKKAAPGGLDLTQAPIIVSAGRGVGAPDKLEVIQQLATALGGEVGASRAVTDAGWLPHERQIGSSGVSVSPKLYIACGISGAIQHVVGMKGSGYIVAVNKDADAPIFGIADVGVVGDLFEILPALTRAVKEAKG
jgi:electron transfer flavoprotein alpha subunit